MAEVRWGSSVIRTNPEKVFSERVSFSGEDWYCIRNFDAMDPFLISVVSSGDHWLYVSSRGGLTCGRKNPDQALFPYRTDDQLHDAHHHTGPLTCLLADRGDGPRYWRPFDEAPHLYSISRNLYKNTTGDRLVFEEVNHDLGLAFGYEWGIGNKFGFIRTCRLANRGDSDVHVSMLDGLRNLLPAGVGSTTQNNMSTLVDAYKQSERLSGFDMALFSLSSLLSDRAEPSEALKATTAWCHGLDVANILLSTDQLAAFVHGGEVESEDYLRGRRCHFLLSTEFDLSAQQSRDWYICADVSKSAVQVTKLQKDIKSNSLVDCIKADLNAETVRLRERVAMADGIQTSNDPLRDDRHFANTLFNIMRGGVFEDGNAVRRDDYLQFVSNWNRPLTETANQVTDTLGPRFLREQLLCAADETDDPDMQRLALEYLPLVFARRHGDPSRPWNRFNIDLYRSDGGDKIHYEGNWRDIFQNWEALAFSYPEYLGSFITKFVNASTPDGFNPYRISSNGIDWEVPEPDNPWSNIGYWGDHQANYLPRLLSAALTKCPQDLHSLLTRRIFVYADVPYRIRGYKSLLEDPYQSIEFCEAGQKRSDERFKHLGADGRLVQLQDGSIHHVTLLEKLLLNVLVRLGNFVPQGGIWMNTQRPEWNDANNALAGYGLSVVTLCYLRGFMELLVRILNEASVAHIKLSSEVTDYFAEVSQVINDYQSDGMPENSTARRMFMDKMGAANQAYREKIYKGFSGQTADIEMSAILIFLRKSLACVDQSVAANRREDRLFHSYNILHVSESSCEIGFLPVMLEGQVAVLNSGLLTLEDCAGLLDALRKSDLYCSKQNSYLLYPDRQLPLFLEKNVIEQKLLDNCQWLSEHQCSENPVIVTKDSLGNVRFNADFKSVRDLRTRMRSLHASSEEINQVSDVYEQVFRHHRFTGRSGAMYKYEGLGSIYWHMVSKLLLATGELAAKAHIEAESAELPNRLIDHYRKIRAGIGLHKSPAEYGAFTTDPYSHTPGHAGVQQPGMTGQVKEDYLVRFIELGIRMEGDRLLFEPFMLSSDEFTDQGYIDFSLCGVPVRYRLSEEASIEWESSAGAVGETSGNCLGFEETLSVLRRDASISRLSVNIQSTSLL